MKKMLSLLTALTFLTAAAACTEKEENSSSPAVPDVTVSQTMYKEEHVEFPEDKRFTEGLTYIDGQGVRLIYTDNDNNYKIADYDENMAVKSTTELFTAEDNAFVNFISQNLACRINLHFNRQNKSIFVWIKRTNAV